MQEFAIQAEEAIDAHRQVYDQEAGEKVRRRENASCILVKNLENMLHTWIWNLLSKVPILRQLKLIFKDSRAMLHWSAGTMNSGTSLHFFCSRKAPLARSGIVSGVGGTEPKNISIIKK